MSELELDLRGHNAGTTLREGLAYISAYMVLAFKCTFVAREDSGTYVCDYPRVQEQAKREVKPKCNVINSDGINRRDRRDLLESHHKFPVSY